MLFWIFISLLTIGTIAAVIGKLMFDHTKYDTEWLINIGDGGALLGGFALIICFAAMLIKYADIDAKVAQYHERYEALTYQLENNLYDNDNDVGKKELYSEIAYWNEDLAYNQALQDNFWIGIFVPDVYDQFEYIDYERRNDK